MKKIHKLIMATQESEVMNKSTVKQRNIKSHNILVVNRDARTEKI